MNVERFNEVYNQFITTLTKKFKFGEKEMSKKMSVAIENDPKHYVDMFIKNLLPHIDEVSACNIDFFRFSKSSILLCDNLEMTEVFDKMNFSKGGNSSVLFHNICTYIMTLYLVLLKDENNIEKYVNANYCDYETYPQMVSVINAKDEIVDNWKANNSEVKEDNVKSKQNDKKSKKDCEKSTSEQKTAKQENKSTPSSEGLPFPMGDIENTQIGKLAGELAEKIENNGNITMPEITNPSDIFSMMFSGGTNNPISNIMSTVCSELDSKIKNGEVDQNALFNEAQGLMGSSNMFNPAEMMKNMPADMMKNMANIGKDDDGISDDEKSTNKDTEQKKQIKVKRKKKVLKKPPSVKKKTDVNKQDKILEETLDEVINEE